MKVTLPKKAKILSPKAKINKAALVKEYAQLAASYESAYKALGDIKSKCGNCCKANLESIQTLELMCNDTLSQLETTLLQLDIQTVYCAKLEQKLKDEQAYSIELEGKICKCEPSFFSKVKAFFLSIKNYIVNSFKNKAI